MIDFSKPFRAIVDGEELPDLQALQITLEPSEDGKRIAIVYYSTNGRMRTLTLGLEDINFEQLKTNV